MPIFKTLEHLKADGLFSFGALYFCTVIFFSYIHGITNAKDTCILANYIDRSVKVCVLVCDSRSNRDMLRAGKHE